MDLVSKYIGAGSVIDKSIAGKIGRFFGRSAGVPSSIAFSANVAWQESKQVYAEAEKDRAASKILSYGNDKIPTLHSAWAAVKELAKKTEQTKKNLAMSGLPTGQYINEIQALDLQLRQAEGACQRDCGVSYQELDSCFGKFNSSEDFKTTAKRAIGPLITELDDDHKKLFEQLEAINKAVAANREIRARIDASRQSLGF